MPRLSPYWIELDKGKVVLDEEAAIAKLLQEGVLFCNCRYYSMWKDGKTEGEIIVLFVILNDVFAWASADGEDITTEELPELFKLFEENPKWGAIIWGCKKRQEQPQRPMKDAMIKDASWNEELESLPENHYDRFCRNEFLRKHYEIS